MGPDDPSGPSDFDPSRPPQAWPSNAPPPPLPSLPGEAQPAPIPSIGPRGAPRLVAMRLGELLDASINLYRQHWKLLVGIVAYVFVPLQFLQAFLTREISTSPFTNPNQLPTDSHLTSTIAITSIFSFATFVFVLPFLTAAIARATSEVYVGGSPSVKDIYRFALSLTPAVLWATFLVFLVTALGFIALIIPGVIFFVRLSFTPSIVAIEGKRGRKAMGRSWQLAQGYFWKILGTVFLAGILTSIVGGILQIPLEFIASRIGSPGWILRAIGGSAAAIVTRPFSGIVVVLLYFDMRI